MPADSSKRDMVPVLGRRLSYLERGRGPAVLLVHGLGAGAHIWEQLELPGFRMIAVDLPGCGGSEPRTGRQGPRELSVVLGAFMDQVVGDEPFAVIGHSLGALVCAELALAQPRRVRAAVLVDPAAGLPLAARLPAAPLVGEAVFGLSSLVPPARPVVRAWLSMIWADRRAIRAETVERYRRAVRGPGYFPAALAGLRGLANWRPGGRLAQLSMPVALIWGTRDRFFPLAHGRRLARLLPDASFHPLEGCGHSPPEEAPGEVSAIAHALLERAFPAPGA